MLRERKQLPCRWRVVVGGFALVIIVMIVLQTWTSFTWSACIDSSASASDRYIYYLWETIQLGTCTVPTFSHLSPIINDDQIQIGYLLEMNCTNGKFSFSFNDNPRLQHTYEKPTTLLSTTALATNQSNSIQTIVQHEYVRTLCSSIPHFPERTFSNILVKHDFNQAANIRAKTIQNQLQTSNPQSSQTSTQTTEFTSINVIVLVINNLSEPHFDRMMPNTKKYLKSMQKLNHKRTSPTSVFHFERYHAPTQETLLNHLALFSGMQHLSPIEANEFGYFKERLRNSSESQTNQWLWEWYQSRGYVTLFGEEHCDLKQSVRSLFNDIHMIDSKWSDLFCQFAPDPFMGEVPTSARLGLDDNLGDDEDDDFGGIGLDRLSQEHFRESIDGWKHGQSCIGNQYIHSLSMEFLNQFLDAYRQSVPVFASMVFMEAYEPSMSRIKTLDLSLVHFLKLLHQSGVFANSAIILTSDQGMNRGSYSESHLGQIELQEPLLYTLIPKSIFTHYPQIHDNLQSNQWKLVSTFDIYSTLRRIPLLRVPKLDPESYRVNMTFSSSYSYKDNDRFIPPYSVSIVDEILDHDRSCSSAGLTKEMCRCNHTMIPPEMMLPFLCFVLGSVLVLCWWCCYWSPTRKPLVHQPIYL